MFYTIILPSLEKKQQIDHFILYLQDYESFIRALFIKFRYGKGNYHNPKYYNFLQSELIAINQYQEALKDKLDPNRARL